MWDYLKRYKTDHAQTNLPKEANDNGSTDARIWKLGPLSYDPLVWHRFRYALSHHLLGHKESPYDEAEAKHTEERSADTEHSVQPAAFGGMLKTAVTTAVLSLPFGLRKLLVGGIIYNTTGHYLQHKSHQRWFSVPRRRGSSAAGGNTDNGVPNTGVQRRARKCYAEAVGARRVEGESALRAGYGGKRPMQGLQGRQGVLGVARRAARVRCSIALRARARSLVRSPSLAPYGRARRDGGPGVSRAAMALVGSED